MNTHKKRSKNPPVSPLARLEQELSLVQKGEFGSLLSPAAVPGVKTCVTKINAIIKTGKKEIEQLTEETSRLRAQTAESEETKKQIRDSLGELLKFQILSEAISTAHDIQDVLDALEQLSNIVVPITGSGVFLIQEHSKQLTPIRVKNLPHDIQTIVQEQLEEGIIDWVFRERRPTVVPDIQKLPAGEALAEEHNYIIIPLIVSDTAIGFFQIYTTASSSNFTKQDLEILGLLSNQAAVAIENSQLYEKKERTIKELTMLYETGKRVGTVLKQTVDELSLLYETGKKVSSVLKPNQVYKTVIATVCEKMNVSMGWIFEVDEKLELSCKAQHGPCPFPRQIKSGTPLFEAVQKHKSVLYDRLELTRYAGIFTDGEVQCLLCVPLYQEAGTKGVICIASSEGERKLDQNHLRLLQTMANQISAAIENNKLYQDLIQTNKNLTDLQNQLVHSGKLAALGQLAGGIAHEINNPLQIILGRVQMVLMDLEDLNQREEIKIIESETRRIASIVKGLLEFARQGEKSEEFVPVDVIKVLQETVVLVRHQIEVEEITIKEQYDAGIPLISGDVGMLKQVFLNICINAKQAMKAGGSFFVRARSDEQWVSIEFRDTGCGIEPENIDKIFEPFFTTKNDTSGTGLGLSLSYGIIQKHKGEITVKSTPGTGSVFTVRLPIKQ